MKLVVKIGWKTNGRLGVRIDERDDGKSKVRTMNADLRVREELTKSLGNLYTEEQLMYVGYEIFWKTKYVARGGVSVANVDYKEKRECPPEILKFGRYMYQNFVTPVEDEFPVDGTRKNVV